MSFVQYVCHPYNCVSLRVSFAKPHQNLGLFFLIHPVQVSAAKFFFFALCCTAITLASVTGSLLLIAVKPCTILYQPP